MSEQNHIYHRRAAIVLPIVFATLFLLPALTLWHTTGDFTQYFDHEVLPGQFPYVLSKLFGLYAIVLLWLQIMLGLLGPRLAGSLGLHSTFPTHRVLGVATLLVITVHVALFVTATSMRNKIPALDLLWPSFHGYYRSMVSLGLFAVWLIAIGAIAAFQRKRFPKLWRWAHRLSLPAFALIFAHSFLVGSESRVGGMFYLYIGMLASLLVAVVFRYVFSGALFFPEGRLNAK